MIGQAYEKLHQLTQLGMKMGLVENYWRPVHLT